MPRSRNRERAEAFDKIGRVRGRLLLAVPWNHPERYPDRGEGVRIVLPARDLIEWQRWLEEALAVLADPRAKSDG